MHEYSKYEMEGLSKMEFSGRKTFTTHRAQLWEESVGTPFSSLVSNSLVQRNV